MHVEYNIYNKDDRFIGTIKESCSDNSTGSDNREYTLILAGSESDLPIVLYEKLPNILSKDLEQFLKERVNPKRVSVVNALHEIGLEYDWREMIKLNSGRVMTDDFYILTSIDGVETKKSEATGIDEIDMNIEEQEQEHVQNSNI